MEEKQENLQLLGELPHFPRLGNCWVSEKGFIVSDEFGGPGCIKRINALKPREDDIFVISFPKTGTTWLQELVFLIGTNCDFETAKNKHLLERCPFVDFLSNPAADVEIPPPRFFKLHIPYSMLPETVLDKKCKLIYTMRNPKDTLVSFYHFSKSNKLIGLDADFTTFFDLFMNDKVCYGPYWKHYLEFWERRNEDNIFITTFEDMKQDLPDVIRKLAAFIGKKLTEEQVEQIAHYCGFEQMKKNPNTNPDLLPDAEKYFEYDSQKTPVFMRKGQVGDWKNYFTDEMNERMDKSIEEHFGGTGLKFIYEL